MDEFPVGAKVIFSPHTLINQDIYKKKEWTENGWLVPTDVTGTVCLVNRKHHWFRVRYEIFGNVNYECFLIHGERNKLFPRIKK